VISRWWGSGAYCHPDAPGARYGFDRADLIGKDISNRDDLGQFHHLVCR